MAGVNHMHCARCDRGVAVEYKYSLNMRRWWKAYFIVPPLFLVPAAPFLAGDYVVTIPLMMVYMLGFGPALSIVRDPPLCGECGAFIPARA